MLVALSSDHLIIVVAHRVVDVAVGVKDTLVFSREAVGEYGGREPR